MQMQGATKIELDLREVLLWNEASFCSPEATQRSCAISDAIEQFWNRHEKLYKRLVMQRNNNLKEKKA